MCLWLTNWRAAGREGAMPRRNTVVVKACFEQLDQVFTGDAFTAGCFLEGFAELTFQHTISIFCLLLFTQLEGVFTQRFAFALCAVLTRRICCFYSTTCHCLR